jgi:serine/threonine protein kinase
VVFRKELKPDEEDATAVTRMFHDEDRILKMLNTLNNENIIQVYISYKHKGIYNFIFPLADMDLAKFIETSPRPALFESDAAIMRALHGLASAISDVHEFNSKKLGVEVKGCHHDLKPQNILVNGSVFLLADFGLSRFKGLTEDSTSISKGIGEYLAPECRGAQTQRQAVGRKSDIWSFGCIIAEMLSYMANGPQGVRDFRNSRMKMVDQWTNYSFHSSGQLKIEVDNWLTKAAQSSKDANFLLVSDVVRQMLQPNPDRRPDAKTVQKTLGCLHGKYLLDASLQLYQILVSHYENPYFVIEYERLRSWGLAVGLHQSSGPWTWANCLVNLLSRQSLDALQRIFDELGYICAKISSPGNDSISVDAFPGATVEHLGESLPDDRNLHRDNDSLISLLPPSSKKTLERFLFRSILRTDNIDGLRRVESEARAQSLPEIIGVMAELKLTYQIFEKQEAAGELKNRLSNGGRVDATATIGQHSLGTYTSPENTVEDVLIEWRPVNSPSQTVSQELLRRVDNLAGLFNAKSKSSEIRVLECIGFYLDKHRGAFGVLYRFPSGKAALVDPTSLFQLITSAPNPITGKPFLGHRLDIARTIASCILYCHSIGWLHERLNSHNVVFFPPRGMSVTQSRSTPYVIGFSHSRQDKENAFSRGPPSDPSLIHYLHPDYFTEKRFRKLFDYYSVGLVLLEVGLWRTIASIQENYPFHDSEGLRREIIERYLPGLLYSMGEIYYGVVKACLTGELGNAKTPEEDVGNAFQVLVVEKLHKCIV